LNAAAGLFFHRAHPKFATMDVPEALREFLMYVIANLIEHPKQASIAVGTTSSGAVSYKIHLAPDDVRRVVGKNGFTISAIRSLVNVAAAKHGVKVSLRVDGMRDEDLETLSRPRGEADETLD
jgi:predicted RNA-binding protein YlqC (UPF0109 family)